MYNVDIHIYSMPNGMSHLYQLNESISNFKNGWVVTFNFIQILEANSEKTDQTPRSAVSGLVLHCLPMSLKKDSRHWLIL